MRTHSLFRHSSSRGALLAVMLLACASGCTSESVGDPSSDREIDARGAGAPESAATGAVPPAAEAASTDGLPTGAGNALLDPSATMDDGADTDLESAALQGPVGDGAIDVDAVPLHPTAAHPLYPALDLATLPGTGGGSSGRYQSPVLPITTRAVTITAVGAQARAAILTACQTPGTRVTVPNAAGRIGYLDLGNVRDCDIQLGTAVVVDLALIGHLPGPTIAPVHRIRIRGGQLGGVAVDPGSTDIVLDGVVVNNAVVSPASRNPTGVILHGNATSRVDRFAFVNSIIRMVATLPNGGATDGNAFLGAHARNVLFANNNVVTAGNRNAWGFRISGGQNYILIDNNVRVAFHKLVRMNDAPVDYVYIKRGLWTRLATASNNDAFAQLEDFGTNRVFIHDPTVYLLGAQQPAFGAGGGPNQVGKSWQVRRIAWRARSANVISDAILGNYQRSCAAGAVCDYGVGTHSYVYNPNLAAPAVWRSLPAIAQDNPDLQPIAP